MSAFTPKLTSVACALSFSLFVFACGGPAESGAGESIDESTGVAEAEDAVVVAQGPQPTFTPVCERPIPHAQNLLTEEGPLEAEYTRPFACQNTTVHQFTITEAAGYCVHYTLGARHTFAVTGTLQQKMLRCSSSSLAVRTQKLVNGEWTTHAVQNRYGTYDGSECTLELTDRVYIPNDDNHADSWRVRAQAVRADGDLDPVTTFGSMDAGIYFQGAPCPAE